MISPVGSGSNPFNVRIGEPSLASKLGCFRLKLKTGQLNLPPTFFIKNSAHALRFDVSTCSLYYYLLE